MIVTDDDGCKLMCLDCGASATRTRTNVYPNIDHDKNCKKIKQTKTPVPAKRR